MNQTLGLECFVDADFEGGWNSLDADDPSTVLSRTGYVIRYMGCPILWTSTMKTEIALSTTEAEYISLSQAMLGVLLMTWLIEEMNDVLRIKEQNPIVRCIIFEDNNGALELSNMLQMQPRTKHIALKYHPFQQAVKDDKVKVLPINAKEQLADIFTIPLYKPAFKYLRDLFLKW